MVDFDVNWREKSQEFSNDPMALSTELRKSVWGKLPIILRVVSKIPALDYVGTLKKQ